MIGQVLAASASSDSHLWSDLFEVILWGLLAGVGLPIVFGLAMRGLILGGAAQREGRGGAAAAQLTMGVVCSVACAAAVMFALASLIHR